MHTGDVAIFWDYENCPTASSFTGYEVVKKIRCVAHNFGTIKLFKAYLELSDPTTFSKSLALRSELQSSGVSLTDCPHNGRKDVADKMMLVDMLAYAIDNPAPSTIVLISGDRDFAYAVSILRLRRYRVVIISLQGVHPSLKVQASVFLDWNTDVLGAEVIDESPSTGSFPRAEDRRAYVPNCQREFSGRRHPPAFLFPRNRFGVEDESDVDILEYLHNKGNNVGRFRNLTSYTSRDVTEDPSRDNQSYAASKTPFSHEDRHVDSVPVFRSPSRTESAPAALHMNDTFPTPTVVNQPISATAINDGPAPQEPVTGSSFHIPSQSFAKSGPFPVQNSSPNPLTSPVTPIAVLGSSPPTEPALPSKAPLPPNIGVATSTAISPSDVKALFKGIVPTASSVQRSELKVVPPLFKLLVQRLEFHRSKGFSRPFRSGIAVELATQDNTLYRRAGAERFGQYVALAEKAGIVELGGKEGGAWIALRPEWYNAKTD